MKHSYWVVHCVQPFLIGICTPNFILHERSCTLVLYKSTLTTYLKRKSSVLTTRSEGSFLEWIPFNVNSKCCSNMNHRHNVWCYESPWQVAVGSKQCTIHYPINIRCVGLQNKCLLPQVIPIPTQEAKN